MHAATDPQCEPMILQELRVEIEADLTGRLDALKEPQPLREALRYALLGSGKRLRPALALLCCEAAGGRRDDATAAAAALELIHTFSLVHDDLPAMDDDQLRRGQPTLHVQAGEAMAILAGDAMMCLAFQWITEGTADAKTTSRLAQTLAEATTRMIVGQVYDTLGGFSEQLSPADRLHLIHQHKTAALLRAACRMGGLCGGANDAQLQALTDYGEAIGVMFQVVDDLLDVTQTTEHVGKATGKDHQAGKLTSPGVLGPEACRAEVDRLRRDAHAALLGLGESAQPLIELCDYMAVRTK